MYVSARKPQSRPQLYEVQLTSACPAARLRALCVSLGVGTVVCLCKALQTSHSAAEKWSTDALRISEQRSRIRRRLVRNRKLRRRTTALFPSVIARLAAAVLDSMRTSMRSMPPHLANTMPRQTDHDEQSRSQAPLAAAFDPQPASRPSTANSSTQLSGASPTRQQQQPAQRARLPGDKRPRKPARISDDERRLVGDYRCARPEETGKEHGRKS